MLRSLRKNSVVAISIFLGTIAGPSFVVAQQQQGTRGTTTGSGTGLTAGTGATTGTSTGRTASGTTGRQGSSQRGQGLQQPQFQSFGDAQGQNDSGFVGRGTTDTFIGQQQAGQRNARGGFGPQFGGLGAQFGAFGGNQGTGTTTRSTGQTTTRTRAEQLRPQHRVAFSFAPINTAILNSRLQTQMRPLLAEGRLANVEFGFDGNGLVTLQGVAASVDDRDLAEAIARLEPGVRRVDNQIVVPEPVTSPADTPTRLP